MMTVTGRTLPTHWSIYRGTIDGVEGFVVTIDGRSAFVEPEQARKAGAYLCSDSDEHTAPIDIVS